MYRIIFSFFLLLGSLWSQENIAKNLSVLDRIIPRFKATGPINDVLMKLKEETIRKDPDSPVLSIVYFPSMDDWGLDSDDPLSEVNDEEPKPIIVKLDLEQLTVLEIIKSICSTYKLRYKIENGTVHVVHPSEETENLEVKAFSVALSDLQAFEGKGVQKFLESQGIVFNPRSKATYISTINKVIVINTKEELAKVEKCFVNFEVNEKLYQILDKVENNKDNAEILKELRSIKELLSKPDDEQKQEVRNKNLEDKLKIVIPKIRFSNRDIYFFADFIRRTTRDLHEEGESLNIIIGSHLEGHKERLNLDLDDITVLDVIKIGCKQLKLSYKIDLNAVVIADVIKNGDSLKFYEVSADFLTFVQSKYKGDFKKAIQSLGVNFPVGSSISYVKHAQRLVVSNREREHGKLKEILKFFNGEDK